MLNIIKNIDSLFLQILFLYNIGTYQNLTKSQLNKVAPKNVFYQIKNILTNIAKDIVLIFARNDNDISNQLWIYILTLNNYKSTQFIKTNLKNSIHLFPKNNSYDLGDYCDAANVNFKYKIFYDILSIVMLPLLIIVSPNRKMYNRYFDKAFNVLGYYYESRRVLKKHKPKAIVFSNDHLPVARAMLYAAKSIGIPTIYIQHASVTLKYPPLEFDLSLLEGQDSKNKYILKSGKVVLIGMPKFDNYAKSRNTLSEVKSIGIALNFFDSHLKVITLANQLKESNLFESIIIRPHPGIRQMTSLPDGIFLSNPKKESSFDYLKKIQINISGNSSIHLEATMLGVVSTYYNLRNSGSKKDPFGYIENLLIKASYNTDDILSIVSNYSENQKNQLNRIKYYNEAFNSGFVGESSKLAINEIEKFLR